MACKDREYMKTQARLSKQFAEECVSGEDIIGSKCGFFENIRATFLERACRILHPNDGDDREFSLSSGNVDCSDYLFGRRRSIGLPNRSTGR